MRRSKPNNGFWLRLGGGLLAFCLAALFLAQGCTTPKPKKITARLALVKVADDAWPLLADDMDATSLAQAAENSMTYLDRVPAGKLFRFGPYTITAEQLKAAVRRLGQVLLLYPDPIKRTQALKREFILMASPGRDGAGEVLFTGYYEPVMKARKKPAPPYVHPIYALPKDHVTVDLSLFGKGLPKKRLVGRIKGRYLVPYYDRRDIDYQGALKGRAKVLAYLADPVESFFLHIQGSGQVKFADGSRLRLGYAAANGHPYRSIGRMLLAKKMMQPKDMSMQGIKAFLDKNPQLRKQVLGHNPSYVFFRPLSATGGPLGCYNRPLTGGRSIATDRRLFPGLAMAFIVTSRPDPGGLDRKFSRFVLNQDTGGAIRGPGRVDLFYGTGDEAGELAGRTKHLGKLYFFFPRRLAR